MHVEIIYFNEEHVRLQEEIFDTDDSKDTIIANTKKKAVKSNSKLYQLNTTILSIWGESNEVIYQNTFDMFGN